ncbi:MAG: S-methyl-5-thioribose-1-phosphate isomerase [Clostridiales bacterium]|nr:S-methyl-5-thioribose-1-phosphate isomerase [Clostridiales bacterium]
MSEIFTLKWDQGKLILIDQTLLPNEIAYRSYDTIEGVYEAIKTMVVRGAPAIGVASGYAMVLAAYKAPKTSCKEFYNYLKDRGEYLTSSRPTAVNLEWAVNRMLKKAEESAEYDIPQIIEKLEDEAVKIHEEDKAINRAIGENLLGLLKEGDTVLTHCNAGALAASEYGTALSVFYLAKERGFPLKVYVDETRPRLQGAKLTAFELYHAGIDVTLISDNMAAVVMSQGRIDAVIVGCDRVAANGDAANKIGTLNVSILAKHFGIPMYIAAPTPTIDMNCPTGKNIPIEERDESEIKEINGKLIAPEGVKVYNPSFDVTPAENITAIVTEKGVVYPPYKENLAELFED